MKKNALEYFDKLANEKSLEQCFRSIVSYNKTIPGFESVNLKEGTIDLWDIPSYDEDYKPSLHTRKIIDLFAFEVETEAKKVISGIKQEVEGLVKSGIDSKMYLEYITKSLNNYSEIVKDKYQSTPFVLDSITQILKEVNILLPKVKEQIEIDNFSQKHNTSFENTNITDMKAENPLHYFDNLIHYYDYDHEFTGFYADFIIDLGSNIISLDQKNDQIKFNDPDNNQKVTTTSYNSFFEGEVQRETKKAIKNIQYKTLSISEVNDTGFFIKSISKILLSYFEISRVKFENKVFVSKSIVEILKVLENLNPSAFSELKVDFHDLGQQLEKPQDRLEKSIHNVIGYLNQKEFICDDDYKRLVAYLHEFAETSQIPTEIKKIPDFQFQVKNTTLRYSFYVLKHQEEFSHIKSEDMANFIWVMFEQFENTMLKTLESKLATKPTNFHDFLPIIIKDFKLN